MSGATKDTVQKILLLALAAMTVSMVSISVFNYKDNKQKNAYLDNEKALVQEELEEIIKNYEHLAKQNVDRSVEVNTEMQKAEKLLDNLQHTILDYESIIEYRTQMLELRKNNHRMQRKFTNGMSTGGMNIGL
jgi:predicted Rossmann fold nucleotide-binding protein DprA/Smf involved in DNA uptake